MDPFKRVDFSAIKPSSINKEAILYFYKNAEFIFPPYVKQRQFRIMIEDEKRDRFVFKKLSNMGRWGLKMHCIKHKPIRVYHTTSRWLRPDLLGPKRPQKDWLEQRFLGQDLVFDIDAKHLTSKNKSLKEFILYVMKNLALRDYALVQTGSGYHLHFYDFDKHMNRLYDFEKMPHRKERLYQAQLRKIVSRMKKEGFLFDYGVTTDTRRFIRVIGSLHENGKTIRLIERSEMIEPAVRVKGSS